MVCVNPCKCTCHNQNGAGLGDHQIAYFAVSKLKWRRISHLCYHAGWDETKSHDITCV